MDRLLEATYRVEQRHFWWTGLRRFVRPLVADALAGRSHPRILDCGCGTGANLVMLGEFGRASGFDLSRDGLGFARRYGQRRLAQASITHVPFTDSTFDLVTALDVLYSLNEADEAIALAEIRRVLKPGCCLIVSVAALNVLRGNHAIFGAERRRSTRRRLRALLTRAGFEVVRITYSNASIFPLILAVRTGQRLMGLATPEEAGTDVVLPAAPVNAALTALLRLEARALRVMDMPIGSSLLCVARKPALSGVEGPG